MKATATQITKSDREVRTFPLTFRASQEGEGRKIEGYAAIFDQNSEDMGFVERISPSAFDRADMRDVRALFNHDPNYILARTASGTLTLEVDERGLKYAFEVPDTTFGNDFLTMVRRGDISQSSFAFTIADDAWEERDGQQVRTIKQVHTVYDVSPVTYPAYAMTSVTARSLEGRRIAQQQEQWATDERELWVAEVDTY